MIGCDWRGLGRRALVACLLGGTSLGPGLLAAPVLAQAPAISGFSQAVAEAAAAEPALGAFYAARAYAPVWTDAAAAPRRAAFFAALDQAGAHGLPVARYQAETLLARFATIETERERGQLEAAVSLAYLAWARDISSGALEPEKIDAGIVREIKRPDPAALLSALLAAPSPEHFLRDLAPKTPQYANLMRARLQLAAQIGQGGWGNPVPARRLGPGESGAAVVALRDRLMKMGYLGRSVSATYDAALQKAVQSYQFDLGMKADGVAGEATLAEINVAAEERLKSVLVAMERARWLNGRDLGKRHIWVNIADFSARIIDDGKVSFETVTVVGQNRPDRRTPEFSDEMEMMVINPSWSVPRSITVKEYLPMMQRNPGAAGHIQLVDSRGRTISREGVDFAAYNARNFPFAMRQPPSQGNALGLVKFLFPNPYNIYLHDTPSKSLFQREVRDFSHGCIRVGRPFDLAYALLARQVDDPQDYFQKVLKTGAETTVRLDAPVPVHLVYFTAWPNARGRIEYRHDVYGRDAALYTALAKAGVELTTLTN
ncbi:L,D-transpeptidase family protein [Rhodobacter maris]|uniref:Murein L,D-transpeptidase YcbB/YkuD n=1 Tax=Rhodobacter maris TaxID=446682 RepID=A0A285RW06_9RHOB|nr:L,D-transpeptidase family protein [Rhodobacter maris]SOB98712.1 murein L,D-transpeptidase YcbB/YkuD [Rhodobacter maris]